MGKKSVRSQHSLSGTVPKIFSRFESRLGTYPICDGNSCALLQVVWAMFASPITCKLFKPLFNIQKGQSESGEVSAVIFRKLASDIAAQKKVDPQEVIDFTKFFSKFVAKSTSEPEFISLDYFKSDVGKSYEMIVKYLSQNSVQHILLSGTATSTSFSALKWQEIIAQAQPIVVELKKGSYKVVPDSLEKFALKRKSLEPAGVVRVVGNGKNKGVSSTIRMIDGKIEAAITVLCLHDKIGKPQISIDKAPIELKKSLTDVKPPTQRIIIFNDTRTPKGPSIKNVKSGKEKVLRPPKPK